MNAFESGLGAGLGAGIGSALGVGLVSALASQAAQIGEEPVFIGEINGTRLMVTRVTRWTKSGLHLHAITPAGGYHFLAAVQGIPQMLALVQQWQNYISGGGTVESWQQHNYEIAKQQQLEAEARWQKR